MARFQVSARTVEMLGRQQVAGISTAISELFKNAHDAYASHVSAEFYRSLNLFVIRDNGRGMTREEFEDRWLTLGTDSKADYSTLPLLRPIQGRKSRPILGEKGIGRLALAVLGPQVLIQTRSYPPEKNDVVTAFIHWNIFAIPGLRLEDIEIPILESSSGSIPTTEQVTRMITGFRDQLPIEHKNPSVRASIGEIIGQLNECRFDTQILHKDIKDQGRFSLMQNSGMHFYIRPPDEQIVASLKEIGEFEKDTTTIQPETPIMLRTLIGFNNTMFQGEEPPACAVSFSEIDEFGVKKECFTDQEFFTPQDFEFADHYFEGRFDEYGNFNGTVSIFQEKQDYSLVWKDGNGEVVACGPFDIRLGYLQGEKRTTKLDHNSHSYLIRKLNRIGGLYIYRDGVRVLPYGNADNDFLNIEKRRTKSASYYYFSYRRMYGAVELSRSENANLREKAGREGFQSNAAYRQFRAILEHFFVQLAADFFREGGEYSETFIKIREENERNFALQKKREKQRREKQHKFASELDDFFSALEEKQPQRNVEEFLSQLENDVSKTVNSLLVKSGLRIGELVGDANKSFDQICSQYRLSRPRDAGITKKQRRDWEAYQTEYNKLEKELFTPAKNKIVELFSPLRDVSDGKYDYREEHIQVHVENEKELRNIVGRAMREVEDKKKKAIQRINVLRNEISLAMANLIKEKKTVIDGGIESFDREKMHTDVDDARRIFDKKKDEWLECLNALRLQLESVAIPEGMEEKETLAAVEDELEELHEQADVHFELAQIGLALGVLHHEFQTGYDGIADAIKQLKRWADRTPKMQPLYEQLRTKFDQISSYLKLVDPLMKFRNRNKTVITGEDIRKFLIDAFEKRMEKAQIEFRVTDKFKSTEIVAFQSEIYPCFINLIDNSLYWLEDCRKGKKKIELDADSKDIVIADSGPGIPARDVGYVFEMGFTKKPGGRGMGLYIARKSLDESGYNIFAVPKTESKFGGAEFHISKQQNVSDSPST